MTEWPAEWVYIQYISIFRTIHHYILFNSRTEALTLRYPIDGIKGKKSGSLRNDQVPKFPLSLRIWKKERERKPRKGKRAIV